jgi:hypothetical protein
MRGTRIWDRCPCHHPDAKRLPWNRRRRVEGVVPGGANWGYGSRRAPVSVCELDSSLARDVERIAAATIALTYAIALVPRIGTPHYCTPVAFGVFANELSVNGPTAFNLGRKPRNGLIQSI